MRMTGKFMDAMSRGEPPFLTRVEVYSGVMNRFGRGTMLMRLDLGPDGCPWCWDRSGYFTEGGAAFESWLPARPVSSWSAPTSRARTCTAAWAPAPKAT